MSVLPTFAGRECAKCPLKASAASRFLRAYATQVEKLGRLRNGVLQSLTIPPCIY